MSVLLQETFMPSITNQVGQQETREIQLYFDLDVTLVEIVDPGALVNVTDDGCGSTCGACTTGVA
jgi:FxLD family lantipeptide